MRKYYQQRSAMGKQTWRRRASFMDARRMIFECKCIVIAALRLRLAIKPALCQMASKLPKRCPKIHNIGEFWGPPRASLGCRSQRLFWTLPKSSQQTLPERADRPPVQAASRSSEAEPTRARPRPPRPASNLTERLPSNAETQNLVQKATKNVYGIRTRGPYGPGGVRASGLAFCGFVYGIRTKIWVRIRTKNWVGF